MSRLIAMLFALASTAQTPTPAPAPSIDEVQQPKVEAAFASITAHQPQAALDTIEDVLRAYDAARAGETRHIYCATSPTETIAYMGLAAKNHESAVAVGQGYCDALFAKGFALVDLDRPAEARAVYERLVALAPMHSHYLAELGQTYRPERNWATMYEKCSSAAAFADLARPDEVKIVKGGAWRCMAYALTEQHKYDEAAALYRKCLELNPQDTLATHELQYIDEQRRHRS